MLNYHPSISVGGHFQCDGFPGGIDWEQKVGKGSLSMKGGTQRREKLLKAFRNRN